MYTWVTPNTNLDAPQSDGIYEILPGEFLPLEAPLEKETAKDHGSLVMSPFFTSPNHDRY